MKLKLSALGIMLLGNIAAICQSSGPTDQIIIKLKNETIFSNKSLQQGFIGNDKLDRVTQKSNAVEMKKLFTGSKSNQRVFVIRIPQGTEIQQVIDEYLKTGEIEYAEPDYIVPLCGPQGITPNDRYYNDQWGLNNIGQMFPPTKAGADIDMENGWAIELGDTTVVVAILDGGVNLNHPEFAGRIWTNHKEIPNNGIDDDKNGYIDDVKGWDFVNKDNTPADDEGHGTAVTGLLGANGNNSIGYAGVDWNCKLMILKTHGIYGTGSISTISEAIYYAADNGAKVMNCSFGGPNLSTTEQNAINYALNNNVVVVAGMGNSNSETTIYPAGFKGVIAVGATNSNDERWDSGNLYGSNYGSHISVVAPGASIAYIWYGSDTIYNAWDYGTSLATPLVSGLASLLLAKNPTRTSAEIKLIIETTAEDQVGNAGEDIPGWDKYYGHGRINAFQALSVVPANVTGITVSGDLGSSVITTNNGTLQLSAEVTPTNAMNKAVTWSISNGTGEATIGPSGLVSASANGTVTVRATSNDGSGISGTLEITISNQTSTSITDINSNDVFRIYPVPAQYLLVVKLEGIHNKVKELAIYDALGNERIIERGVDLNNENEYYVNIYSLGPGSYYISLYFEDTRISRNFIVAR